MTSNAPSPTSASLVSGPSVSGPSMSGPPVSGPTVGSGSASISLAMTGSGGAGVMTAGQILLEAAAQAGYFGLMARSLGPQIRGGESAALLRLATTPVQSPDDYYDLLMALDWGNIDRFVSELPLHDQSLILCDPALGEAPAILTASGATVVAIPVQETAKSVPGGRPNMVALGLCAALTGVPDAALADILVRHLGNKGQDALSASMAAIRAGAALAPLVPQRVPPLSAGSPHNQAVWSITGNEAAGLGALRGGVRFVAAYPITPATEVLEWLAPSLAEVGGTLVQAEDELASITMCLGASFGGVPSLTATSGPGLALMTEAIGLGVASETPVTVVNVMRGGPSTGIPTKSEQSDLNIAVYGLHGDAPHLVTAPTGLDDCLFTTEWTVRLAEALQVPAILLSDQAQGQARAILPPPGSLPASFKVPSGRKTAQPPADGGRYLRYSLSDDGVSPMAVPGTPGCAYVADGLEHSQRGTPSTQAQHHQEQLDKRLNKLTGFDFGPAWADIADYGTGAPTVAVLTFGSVTQQVREALSRWQKETGGASAIRLIALRLLAPARPEAMAEALRDIPRALVVEQTHGGQFLTLMRAHYILPASVSALHRPGPLALRPHEILAALAAALSSSCPTGEAA